MNIAKYLLTGIVGCLAASSVLANSAGCEESTLDSVSLYSMSIQPVQSDIGKHYQQIIEKIDAVAEKHNWKNYQIMSQDLSVNTSSYGADQFEVSVSVSFQFQASYVAITQATQDLDAYSLSFSRYPDPSGSCATLGN